MSAFAAYGHKPARHQPELVGEYVCSQNTLKLWTPLFWLKWLRDEKKIVFGQPEFLVLREAYKLKMLNLSQWKLLNNIQKKRAKKEYEKADANFGQTEVREFFKDMALIVVNNDVQRDVQKLDMTNTVLTMKSASKRLGQILQPDGKRSKLNGYALDENVIVQHRVVTSSFSDTRAQLTFKGPLTDSFKDGYDLELEVHHPEDDDVEDCDQEVKLRDEPEGDLFMEIPQLAIPSGKTVENLFKNCPNPLASRYHIILKDINSYLEEEDKGFFHTMVMMITTFIWLQDMREECKYFVQTDTKELVQILRRVCVEDEEVRNAVLKELDHTNHLEEWVRRVVIDM
ncbi:hypothetical protein HK096_000580 [Nowakowskiella sp. JEL0078]|nr:hypothetical protein HK096_000580 [Nowakowskiella sp. JEL0078]